MANITSWLSMTITNMRDEVATYGYAVPGSLVKLRINGGSLLVVPIFLFAQSRRVPISRGSPPIP